jgi:hypothetical protein
MITLRGNVPRCLTFLIILPTVMFLAACAPQDQTLTLGANVAVAGQEVADSGVAAYTEFVKQKEAETLLDAQDELIFNPSDNLPELNPPDAAEIATPGIAKFNILKRTYREYQKLTGGTYGQDAATASSGLVSSVNDFGAAIKAPSGPASAISDEASKTIQSFLLVAVTEVQANDVRRLNKGLEALAQAYQVWWKEQDGYMTRIVNEIYDEHKKHVRQYPRSRFDAALVQRDATKPYDARTNTHLYQIDEIRSLTDQQDQALAKFAAVRRNLERLITAHAELSKQDPSLSATLGVLSKIDVPK